VPAVIRSSADWEGKKVKKKKGHPKRKKESLKLCSDNNNTSNSNGDVNGDGNFANCMVMQDVWCGPGMGFSGADAVVGSVDCVVARRNVSIGRGKIDGGEKINQRERERERERDREREREVLLSAFVCLLLGSSFFFSSILMRIYFCCFFFSD